MKRGICQINTLPVYPIEPATGQLAVGRWRRTADTTNRMTLRRRFRRPIADQHWSVALPAVAAPPIQPAVVFVAALAGRAGAS